jgi:hypothetical protein
MGIVTKGFGLFSLQVGCFVAAKKVTIRYNHQIHSPKNDFGDVR